MNKNKNEVLEYLEKNGHNERAIEKITGFMIGNNLKKNNEVIRFRIGNGTWDDFYDWYRGEIKRDPVVELFDFMFKELDNAKDAERKKEVKKHVDFLTEVFIRKCKNK